MSFVIRAMQAVSCQSDDDALYNLSGVTFDTRGTNSITSDCVSSLTVQLVT